MTEYRPSRCDRETYLQRRRSVQRTQTARKGRQAYGFRDMEYFKLRLFFIHEATPAIPG
jgi:hypothetical protein